MYVHNTRIQLTAVFVNTDLNAMARTEIGVGVYSLWIFI